MRKTTKIDLGYCERIHLDRSELNLMLQAIEILAEDDDLSSKAKAAAKKLRNTILNEVTGSEGALPKVLFYTHNDRHINTNMTSRQDVITANYLDLVNAFGEPADFFGDKVDWEWVLEKDGVIATIYNWKNGPRYGYDVGPGDINEWHIGGHSLQAAELVRSILLTWGIKC